jgi:glycosyltransferase involved in cell wall biosynthesis
VSWEPTVSFIIPFHNQEKVVKKTLGAVLNLDYPTEKLQIIVINDGSTDKTESILQNMTEKKRLTLINHKENKGRSLARNAGIRHVNTEIICFLDGDMIIQQDWLTEMLSVLNQNSVVGIAGDTMLAKALIPQAIDKFYYHSFRGARKQGEGVPVHFTLFLFNNTAIKRYALESVGLFDDSFVGYGGEDTDMAIRLWEKFPNGLRFSARAVAEHYHQRTLNQLRTLMWEYGYNNLQKLLMRHSSYKKELGGNLVDSILGYLIFNRITRLIADTVANLFPIPKLIKFIITERVISGARKARKLKNNEL